MKVKVIKKFIDKETKTLHKVGSTFECDGKRLKEIQTAGNYVVVAAEEKKKAE